MASGYGKSKSAYGHIIEMNMNSLNFSHFVLHMVNRIDIDPLVLLDYNNDINKLLSKQKK